jgi:hypothetical protein
MAAASGGCEGGFNIDIGGTRMSGMPSTPRGTSERDLKVTA